MSAQSWGESINYIYPTHGCLAGPNQEKSVTINVEVKLESIC